MEITLFFKNSSEYPKNIISLFYRMVPMVNWAEMSNPPNLWVRRKNTEVDQHRPLAKTASVLALTVEAAPRMKVSEVKDGNRYL